MWRLEDRRPPDGGHRKIGWPTDIGITQEGASPRSASSRVLGKADHVPNKGARTADRWGLVRWGPRRILLHGCRPRRAPISEEAPPSARTPAMTPSQPSTSKLQELAARWATARAAERANYALYLVELCEAIGVERPRPSGSGYEFELAIKVVSRDGVEGTNYIDLFKREHFLLEAKDAEGGADHALLRKAFGQARFYAGHVEGGPPPFLMVLDVGKTLLVWDRWAGTYGGFNAARRFNLTRLHEEPTDVEFLRQVWTDPGALDPRRGAQEVTREIAGRLAALAARLEAQGHDQEHVARFLIRCVFTMFAEDVHLLPDEPFRAIIDKVALEEPTEFVPLVEELWAAMDQGKRFMLRRLLKFNGHFFKDATGIPLDREALALLSEAARADWAHVEPTIFGTLLVRALTPAERHRLGAEYTPREFIERLVRPTVEEPLRERWTAVQAEVLQLRETGKKKDLATAEKRLRDYHEWLLTLRFLDPAAGSGNFLYVTMHVVKRVELEVIRAIEELTGQPAIRFQEVGPWQFHGIEVKPWAREIAELTLWIGFYQWWRQHHDVQPDEPILRDTGTLELRDAVLTWDDVRHDPARDRPDPTPRIPHPVTGELVPDPERMLRYEEFHGARPAPWPEADFLIANPPYLGQSRQREVFGDGYVDALRRVYTDVPDAADYVMYWWYRAAGAVASGRTIRAGLITTNKITQAQNRAVVVDAASVGAQVCWAIADHVWYDGSDGAEVRVAMTVLAKNPAFARLLSVPKVDRVSGDVPIISEVRVPRLNADLSAHADIPSAAAVRLHANGGIASPGFKLHGSGFLIPGEQAEALLTRDASLRAVLKPFRNGKDITSRPRGVFVIDFGLQSEEEARAWPVLFDHVRDHVKPERDANPRTTYGRYWWRFGEPRRELRQALGGLRRYIATPYVSKHRVFTFVAAEIAPEDGLRVLASDDAFHLGVLSSRIHVTWALAAGGRMGVRHTPRYNQSLCFEPFPFPDPPQELRDLIANAAERIEAHRHRALEASSSVTLMKMYDAVDALRSGAPLSATNQAIHAVAACGVLRDLHDELDRLVAEAYGWEWPESDAVILERLVQLHDARVAEEEAGHVRWLRPAFQRPGLAGENQPLLAGQDDADENDEAVQATEAWPATAMDQLGAVKRSVAVVPGTLRELLQRFVGVRRDQMTRHLDTLVLMGEVALDTSGVYTLPTGSLAVV